MNPTSGAPNPERSDRADDVVARAGNGDRHADHDHADKYNDPRAKITTRGVLIGLGIFLLAILGAGLSIYGRKTRLEQTTQFWGAETIGALQLAERIELRPRGAETFESVDLSGTPGLGHLRRLLLDERNYDWTTAGSGDALQDCGDRVGEKPRCIQIRLTDPTANRFDPVEIDVDLQTGWLGPSDGSQRVQVLERAQPKLANYFATIISVQQLRSDFRDP